MFLVFVIQTFFLYLIALVHSFHGTQHTTTIGKAIKFIHHRFFNQVGEFMY